ncbi:MAG: hypothetical protein AB1782_12605 [Cyanobacteriota bacterium]
MLNGKYFIDNYKKLYKLYKKAGEITNVPPHFLAALHYRENAFNCKSPGPGGPLQFDPPLGKNRVRQLITDYTSLNEAQIDKLSQKGQNNIFVALVLAGCFVQAKLKHDFKSYLTCGMKTTENQKLLMRAFELYNGTAYGSAWNSPYVVNMLDINHSNMRIRGTYIDKKGIRRRVNILDKRPGAYTVFKYLENKNEI